MSRPIHGRAQAPAAPPPLALYVHIPWCVRKCPYCDFNSRSLRGEVPETAYVERLLRDLEQDLADLSHTRALASVYLGGGTPSLFSGGAVARLLRGVRELVELPADAEISLEANPGTADAARFAAYRAAGVNRLSIGAQSLSASHLERIGRIHGPAQVRSAVDQARRAGFENLNLDLMYALPGQTVAQAYRDLEEALALQPEHLSYYQLTIEAHTAFHNSPPPRAHEDRIADMRLQGASLLRASGMRQYEVSAYARDGYHCRHNRNYWEFGDYLGIGAGAHGKLTDLSGSRVERRWKLPDPVSFLDPANRDRLVGGTRLLSEDDLVLEFAMNALRLLDGFDPRLFERHTGLAFARIRHLVEQARAAGLLAAGRGRVVPTERGRNYLDDLLLYFVRG